MKYFIMLLLIALWSDKVLCQSMENDWHKMNRSKERALQDFQQQKFGMFIHWGLYAIPGGIWNGKTMEEMGIPSVAEWIQLVAKIPRKEYADLAALFNPVDFDADHIVNMAKEAGMKYIVITSKHHDGFALFESKVSDFDIMDATPFKRDIVRELYEACKRHQLEFGVYYSHNIDWADGADAKYATTKAANDLTNNDTDSFGANLWDPSPNGFSTYLKNKAIPQVKELLEQFPGIRYIWFDMPGLMTPEQSYTFYKTVYDINPDVIIAERIGNDMGDYAIPGDNRIPTADDQFDKPWEAIGTFNHSWGYKSYDNDWKSADELLYWLIEIVSKGGNYMLNIGPDAKGNVAPTVMNSLQKLGSWMAVNNEAIYGSKPWKVQREGPTTVSITDTEQREKEGFKVQFTSEDFWFTERGNQLYAISLELPESQIALVKSLARGEVDVKQVEILGAGKVAFRQTEEGLTIKLPKSVQKLPKGYTLKITQN